MSNIVDLIQQPKSEIFRRVYIKRRSATTGTFETDWQDITAYIKSFGSIRSQIDDVRFNKFTFGNAKIVVYNDDGFFNPNDLENSFWYGYLDQQRTLVKIVAGFEKHTKVNGRWSTRTYPGGDAWDTGVWDASLWDDVSDPTVFIGLISGDILYSESNQVTYNIKPLSSVFQDFPAANLTFTTIGALTASGFVGMVRDQQDSTGAYVFRPFFGNTTTYFDISTTTNVYGGLNTTTSELVRGSSVWDLMNKLAEAELFVPYVTRGGTFKFVSRDANTTAVSYEFHGAGSFNSQYGHTIKKISSVGKKISKYYSRVRMKFAEGDTETSYVIYQADFSVSPNSNAWVYGYRTLELDNTLVATTALASTIAQTVYNEVSNLKTEIDFVTSFVPHLDILDRFSITYDPNTLSMQSLWDLNNWATATGLGTDDDLVWDNTNQDPLVMNAKEFKFLSFEIDLDKLENRFVAREV